MHQNSSESTILGIDPGTRITGYGLIRIAGNSYTALDYGCIRPPEKQKLTDRYLVIFNGIETLIEKFKPDVLVVETQFVQKNVQSALKLGMARGIAIIAAKRRGIPIFEYSPTRAKKAVVGTGKASKFQVQGMVQRHLNLAKAPEPEDAADALALAICHAHAKRFADYHQMEI
jgi:crossover junction endodeoxyribonuclease RuvC